MSVERSDAQRRLQRSPRFVLSFSLVIVVFAGAVSIPEVGRVLSIRAWDVWWLAGASIAALTMAGVAFRAWGARSRWYIAACIVEGVTYGAAAMTAIYRSRPDSIFWLLYLFLGALNATVSDYRHLLRIGIAAPPVFLAVAYLAFRGDVVGAGISLVSGSVVLLAFEVQAVTARRLDERTAAFDAAQAELAELRLARDRHRIARDLHDGLGADLAAIAWRAERLMIDPSARAADLATISARAAQGMDDMRTIVWALKEPSRTWTEVGDYLRSRLEELGTPRTHVTVEVAEGEGTLSGEHASHVLRAAEEAVRNAVRHADASEIVVRVSNEPALLIEIEDDGRGIPAENERRSGLSHLAARARARGGALRVETRDTGTCVTISAPHAPPTPTSPIP